MSASEHNASGVLRAPVCGRRLLRAGRLTREEIKVRRRIIDRPRTGKLRLTPEQVARVRDRNAASNERLRKRLFPDRETLFAATRQDEPK